MRRYHIYQWTTLLWVSSRFSLEPFPKNLLHVAVVCSSGACKLGAEFNDIPRAVVNDWQGGQGLIWPTKDGQIPSDMVVLLPAIASCVIYGWRSPYIRTYVHTYHYITLHYITLHCIALHYVTLHYITLHCIALRYITLYIYIYMHTYIFVCVIDLHHRNTNRIQPLLLQTKDNAAKCGYCDWRLAGTSWYESGTRWCPSDESWYKPH